MVDAVQQLTGAEEVVWNLADLVPSADEASIQIALDEVLNEAQSFAVTYRGKVAALNATGLAKALKWQGEFAERFGALINFAQLQWTTETTNPAYGALIQKMQEYASRLEQITLFFTLEWTNAPDSTAELLTDPALEPYKHFLAEQRKLRPYRLSEPEEKILSEKEVTGRSAWSRFYGQTVSSIQYDFDGKKLPQEAVLRQLYNPDRRVRERAATSITAGLRTQLPTLTYVFNTVLADKASDDRLRKFPTWITSRNVSNEASDESVQALIDTVTSRYDIVARYYNIKKRLLGLDELYDYDRYAPLEDADSYYSWDRARDTVLAAFYGFDAQVGSIAQEFFDKKWIHAPVQPGKRGGAYASPTVTNIHPYIFVNYSGQGRDVMTLAHELGHGIHMRLSQPRGYYGAGTPLTTAETASVFAEMMVFNDMMTKEPSVQVKVAMLAKKIEDTFATVFRQISMNRFEEAIHTHRRTRGELTTQHITEHWLNTQRAMFQNSVNLRDDYGIWWSYVSHFISVPGYVYAYAFGELLVMALLGEYRKQGDSFVPRYIEMLSAGGSDSPTNITAKAGINLNDPTFWQQGVNMINDMVTQLEGLVEQM